MKMEVKISKKPVDYTESMKILEQRVEDVYLSKKEELLWILEHDVTYTSGTSGNNIDVIDKNLNIIKTNRGGKITVHSPGQKIVYFVINLNKRGKDIRKLVRKVENCIIKILSNYNVKTYSDAKNIGIWLRIKGKEKKVAAIGIKVKKWIAYHGFSINIKNDLNLYNKIIPCGIKDKGVISIFKFNKEKCKDINKIITEEFLNIFP
tara:strand:- start:1536 stop:2153 length:618 start_codon:yes stop_codon:yes gene_type:complete